jgi:hypothetical protein
MPGFQPLSAGQEAVWLLHRLNPGSTGYSILTAVHVRGLLDDALLERAVQVVAERHPVLRSRFVELDGCPGRVELGPEAVRLDVREVGDLDEGQLLALIRAVYEVPFRLAEEPPLRVTLLRLRPRESVLVLVVQHIASDATSQWLVLRELLDAHQSLARTGHARLSAVRASYGEHVAAERRLLAGPRGQQMAAYWGAVRSGAVPAELPADRPRPAISPALGATCRVALPRDAGARVSELARKLAITPHALLTGIFQAMVYRYGGGAYAGHDSLIGCAASNRSPQALNTIGYFVNLLLLRSSIRRGATFREVFLDAHRQVLGGIANVGYPTVLLGGGEPLARLAFTLFPVDRLEPRLPPPTDGAITGPEGEYQGLSLAMLDVANMEGQFDLNAEARISGDDLTAVLRYDTAIFDEASVRRFADGYVRLLEAALADPGTLIHKAPLAS